MSSNFSNFNLNLLSKWTKVKELLSIFTLTPSYHTLWLANGVMYKTIDFYAGDENPTNIRDKNTCKKLIRAEKKRKIICSIIIMITAGIGLIRLNVPWLSRDSNIAFWLQDCSTVVGGPPLVTLTCFSIWSTFNVIIIRALWKEQSKSETIIFDSFVVIKFPERAEKYGLTRDMAKKLRKHYKAVVFFGYEGAIVALNTGIILSCVMWYKYHPVDPWSVLMSFQFILWCATVGSRITYFFGTFYITCLSFALKLDKIRANLLETSRKTQLREVVLLGILEYFTDTCRKIEKSNQFWKHSLGYSYSACVAINALLLFTILFVPIDGYLKLNWIFILFTNVAILAIISYSGDIVTRKCFRLYGLLNSLSTRGYSLNLKLKLAAAIEMTADNFVKQTSWSSQRKMIGFSCFDVVYLSDNDYIAIPANSITYLFLIHHIYSQ